MTEAFENTALAMCEYMSPLARVNVDPGCAKLITEKGDDLGVLLFRFLTKVLDVATTVAICNVRVTRLENLAGAGAAAWEAEPSAGPAAAAAGSGAAAGTGAGAREPWVLEATLEGERFGAQHERGHEIKAITLSAGNKIEFNTAKDKVEINWLVDI